MIDVSPQATFGIDWLRDTVVSTWIMMALIVGAILVLRRTWPLILEWLIEFLDELIAGTIGRPTAPYLPFIGSMIIFLIVANNLGIIPGIVTPSRDISTPAAMAIIVLVAANYFGIRAKGGLGYLKHVSSPIFMLVLEVIGQLSRTLSLTLRLFGNIVSAELVVAVIYSLVPSFAPLPLMILGMITGILQAYVFVVLTISYIASAVVDVERSAPQPAVLEAESPGQAG